MVWHRWSSVSRFRSGIIVVIQRVGEVMALHGEMPGERWSPQLALRFHVTLSVHLSFFSSWWKTKILCTRSSSPAGPMAALCANHPSSWNGPARWRSLSIIPDQVGGFTITHAFFWRWSQSFGYPVLLSASSPERTGSPLWTARYECSWRAGVGSNCRCVVTLATIRWASVPLSAESLRGGDQEQPPR